MLSTKCIRIHGMKDGSWTIRDKIHQYRGVLKLHAREKKVRVLEAAKLKKRVSKNLKSLITDVREYRGIVRDVASGDKRRMHTVLQEHKDFQLAYENLDPKAVEEGVFQDSCLKRKQLDKLYYEKKKKMKEFFDLKLECAILSDKYEREKECLPNYLQQKLITEYERFMAKQNAAKSIRTTYRAMLKILEKDTIYFDAVLETLKEDHKVQCKVLLKATVMGQLAAENLDDTRERYKLMASEVWINMRERERSLNVVRSQVEDLWAYAQSLVRSESDTDFPTKTALANARKEDNLDKQIRQLENTFDKVKDTLSVRSYDELFSRLESQMKQKTRLFNQFEKNLKERDALLNSKNHALLALATLEHSTVTTMGQYKADKKTMLEEIEIQKKRETEYKIMRKARGELLVNVRAALQNMLGMLVCVKETKSAKKATDKKIVTEKAKQLEEIKEEDGQKSTEAEMEMSLKCDGDALALLECVGNKVNALFAMSDIKLAPEKEEKARDLYQRYISDYRSKMTYADVDREPTGIFVEHEVIDSSVLSRAEIKLRSRQLVEAHVKPE